MGRAIVGVMFLLASSAVSADEKDIFDHEAQVAAPDETVKIVFIADGGSHGAKGNHEFMAGAALIARDLNKAYPDVFAVVHSSKKWPSDLSHADAVVVLLNHGGRAARNKAVIEACERGAGFAALHYGVEVRKGEEGDRYLAWMGGHFETHWSVNPHWVAKFTSFPDHPVARGVTPFEANDEWYYHMRFQPDMKGVTPILKDLPPPESLKRGDGAHSGNPHVRAAVLDRKEPQVVAWTYDRPGGGRGFGFTGLHKHFNLAIDGFRKTLVNGVAWTAKLEIPGGGVPTATPTVEELGALIDEVRGVTSVKLPRGKPRYESGVVRGDAVVEIDVDISGAKRLILAVDDGGDGHSHDWADWVEPRLEGPDGEVRLTTLKWKVATTGWGSVHVDKNAAGKPMVVAGKPAAWGIGTHAVSAIEFDIAGRGFTRFRARGGIDSMKSKSPGSIRFRVYATGK